MDPLSHDIGFAIKKIHDAIAAAANAALRPYDLTLAQADFLRFLAQRSTPTTLRDLELHFHLKHPTVVGIVHRLEEKGFVSTETAENDRRCRLVRTTARADEVRQILHAAVAEMEQRLTRGLSEEEQALLLRWLRWLYDNITVE